MKTRIVPDKIKDNRVYIYDNGGKTWDRFTFVIKDKTGFEMWYGSSNNPFNPQGYGQFVGSQENSYGKYRKGKHQGKRITFNDCPDDVKKFITQSCS